MAPRRRASRARRAAASTAVLLAVAACTPLVPHPRGERRADAGAVRVPGRAQTVEVVRVVDGDTVAVRALRPRAVGPLRSRAQVTVRLLEVDTPETVAPGRPVECYGPEATDALTDLLPPGSRASVVRDVELRDPYGRYLLYVWTAGGTFVNERLVATGAARAVLYPPNDRHIVRLRAAERAARAARAGLWGACGDA